MIAFRREPVDTIPFFRGYGIVAMPVIAEFGYRFPNIHTDVNMMVQRVECRDIIGVRGLVARDRDYYLLSDHFERHVDVEKLAALEKKR
jgi:hypothetical protein